MLVSDIGMPGENGYELIRQIRMLRTDSLECVDARLARRRTRTNNREVAPDNVLRAGVLVNTTLSRSLLDVMLQPGRAKRTQLLTSQAYSTRSQR